MLCHGCKQTPEEIAQGTRITDYADRAGCVVLLPRQKKSANPWQCWNWFDKRTAHGEGEAAIVAAQIRHVRRAYRVDRKRILVAGMSAGGALAAIIGVRFPNLVSAIAVHSGLACGAARGAATALSVMQRGPDQDVEGIAGEVRAQAQPRDLRVPILAIHGDGDPIVAPRNSAALVRQYLRLNGHPAVAQFRCVGVAAAGRCRDARPAPGWTRRDRARVAPRRAPCRPTCRSRRASATRGAAATPRSSTTMRGHPMPPP